MSALGDRLARHIASAGPITIADYMAAALSDPEHGYYRAADPLGAAGDFVTAPEISQLFGELIGAWLIDAWERIGRPDPVRLVELGPGRGTLMADALRMGRLSSDWLAAADLHLVEINPVLRQMQGERLSAHRPHWHDSLGTVPDGPLLLVANEFFDALPIRQIVYADGAWRERLVGWTAAEGFRFVLSASPSPLATWAAADLPSPIEGSILELSPASIGVAAQIARRIATDGGAALLIDYGRDATAFGDSLQAVRRHEMVGVLDAPGTADLSAHVDFGALARTAAEDNTTPFGPVRQGDFLRRLGIRSRADRLKRGASPAQALSIDRGMDRLTHDDAMGGLFKALAIAQPGLTPAGFSDG